MTLVAPLDSTIEVGLMIVEPAMNDPPVVWLPLVLTVPVCCEAGDSTTNGDAANEIAPVPPLANGSVPV